MATSWHGAACQWRGLGPGCVGYLEPAQRQVRRGGAEGEVEQLYT